MKFRINFWAAIVMLLYLSSCMQDHPNPWDVAKKVKVNASIDEMSQQGIVKTRVVGNTWTNGDAIGIFMKKSNSTLGLPALAENVRYITNGTSAFVTDPSNEIRFPYDGSKVDFIAYYPHSDNLNSLTYDIDVSNQNNLPNIDLLYSNNVLAVDSTAKDINLVFKHQLTNVILNFSMDVPGTDLSGLEAKITNVNQTADFSLVAGTLGNLGNPGDVLFNVTADGTMAQAILLPENDLTDKIFYFELDSIVYSFDLSNATSITSFDKSTKYTFNITLKQGEGALVGDVSATIDDWITGPSEDIIANEDLTPRGGSEEDPFTVDEARNALGRTQVWVKGFIVGYYSPSNLNGFKNAADTSAVASNIALAFSSTETLKENTFPIQLSTTPTAAAAVRSNLNLKDNPDNFQKEVSLKGDIATYFGTIGLINVREAILEGVRYPD